MAFDFRQKSITTSFGVALIATFAMVALHNRWDQSWHERRIDNSKQVLPSSAVVQLWSLGFDRVLSDLFWLGLVQYLGEERPRGKGFVSTYDYVDLVTRLDPYFVKAYWFGCWSVADWQQRPDLAEKLLVRGTTYNPQDWNMPYMIGVNAMIFEKNAKKAAIYYARAAKLPGAPEFLARQAQVLDSAVPGLVKQWSALNSLYSTTKDPGMKATVKPQLKAVLMAMYREAPTQVIRDSALQRVKALDAEP